MKKKLKTLICCVLLILVTPVGIFGASLIEGRNLEVKEVTLYYNGVQLEQKGLHIVERDLVPGLFPQIDIERGVYVPIRIFEIIRPDNYKVEWNALESKATLTMTDTYEDRTRTIVFDYAIGSRVRNAFEQIPGFEGYIAKDNMMLEIFMHEGSTMVPANAGMYLLSERFDYDGEKDGYVYYKDALNLSDSINFMNLDYRVYNDNNVNMEDWIAMQYLSQMDSVIIANTDGTWNMSIIKWNDGETTETAYVLGDNFDLIRRANEDMQMDCNGVKIKRVNRQFFINKADLIKIGFIDGDWKPLGER